MAKQVESRQWVGERRSKREEVKGGRNDVQWCSRNRAFKYWLTVLFNTHKKRYAAYTTWYFVVAHKWACNTNHSLRSWAWKQINVTNRKLELRGKSWSTIEKGNEWSQKAHGEFTVFSTNDRKTFVDFQERINNSGFLHDKSKQLSQSAQGRGQETKEETYSIHCSS